MLCFLHVHRRVLQSVMQLHLITRSRFSGAGPTNFFFFGGSKLLLPGARPALSFVFFRFDSCLLVRRWIHIIKRINGLAANYEVRPSTQFLDRHCARFP